MHHFNNFISSNKLFSHHEIQLVLPLPSSEDAAQGAQVGGGWSLGVLLPKHIEHVELSFHVA